MARYKGKDGAVQVGGTDIAEVESFDLTDTANEMEADILGQDWTDAEGGKRTMTGTINLIYDPGGAQQSALIPGATVSLTLFPVGNTTGLEEISGDFLVTERGRNTVANDLVKSTVTVRNKGTVTFGTVA